MTSKYKWISFVIGFFVLIVILDFNAPKVIDWTKTFATNDKIPYGLYIFDQEILAKNPHVIEIKTTPFEYFEYNSEDKINNKNSTFFYINKNYSLDKESSKLILKRVNNGDSFFVSCENFGTEFLEKWHLTENSNFNDYSKMHIFSENKYFEYDFKPNYGESFFEIEKQKNQKILGYLETNKEPNYIKISYGKGNLFLHSFPSAFSNFQLLKKNHFRYAEKILKHLPKQPIYWINNENINDSKSNSPLRFVLQSKALRMSWYLILFLLSLFTIFNIKRKQRIIPILESPKNTTEEFVKTISNLYKLEEDYPDVVGKKIVFFLEKIRSTYLINTHSLDEEFVEKLTQKSGKDSVFVSEITNKINHLRKENTLITKDDLIEIDKLFHSFFETTKH